LHIFSGAFIYIISVVLAGAFISAFGNIIGSSMEQATPSAWVLHANRSFLLRLIAITITKKIADACLLLYDGWTWKGIVAEEAKGRSYVAAKETRRMGGGERREHIKVELIESVCGYCGYCTC
jgi:hypothetical protein